MTTFADGSITFADPTFATDSDFTTTFAIGSTGFAIAGDVFLIDEEEEEEEEEEAGEVLVVENKEEKGLLLDEVAFAATGAGTTGFADTTG